MAKGEITAQEGSFPLTRGKLDSENNLWEELRLISAHAGKTSATHGRHSDAQAHPRSRGENSRRPHKRTIWRGSSPLTRGKPSHCRFERGGGRLIPAHAGKTGRRSRPCCRSWAHPRSRGENRGVYRYSEDPEGSSPLTRGKLQHLLAKARRGRLIPAHAGKTHQERMSSH